MIQKLWTKLKRADDRIRILKLLIEDTKGLKCGMSQGIPHSGYGRPTESAAIRLTNLKESLICTEYERAMLCGKLAGEKKEFPDTLLWELIRDHFYSGYSWKKTAEKHHMKESAVKMRFSRFLKKYGASESLAYNRRSSL